MSDLKLQHLKSQADALGVKYHHKAGIDKIQKAIDAHLDAQTQAANAPVKEAVSVEKAELPKVPKIVPMTAEQFIQEQRRDNKLNAGRLIHCTILCNDPNKREWPGEIISVGSAKLGTWKKYVPYGGVPYHLPKIIYDMLLEKNCSHFYNTIDPKGNKVRKSRQVKAYTIGLLDPLTPVEIKELARQQAMREGTEPA